ncbi:MAG TPA: hypothetical protein VKG62_01105 [Solirubrobacteraceae bacterium]|nr:hypothetical protein [Solirubrobacteraceae bacterium]
MAYTTADARAQVLDSVAEAADELGEALTALSGAYEGVDEQTGERLEEEIFRPVQIAYGRAKRTYAEFAARHELPGRSFESAAPWAPATGVRGLLDGALAAVQRADGTLATLQDSMLPIEVGDPPLRAGLEQIRELIGEVGPRTRALERTLGR